MSWMRNALQIAKEGTRNTARLMNPVRILSGLGKLDQIDLMQAELEFIRTHMSSYLGDGIALTHLLDETPIFVNSNDWGPPANYINGGRYEEDVLAVLLSFVRDDTVFLDIGANVGSYSLQVAHRVKQFGQVHAFEPHPVLRDLLRRSRHLNGLTGAMQIHPYGLSDTNATQLFSFPRGHLGGGSVQAEGAHDRDRMYLHVKRLDDVFGDVCDLMKIDVEGHELHVLQGMPRLIARSPNLKILFENYDNDEHSAKRAIEALLREAGFALYGIGGDAGLTLLRGGELERFDGYVLAAREQDIGGDFNRRRISIYPRQLRTHPASVIECSRERLVARAPAHHTLFFGPYWFLPRGDWRLRVEGDLGRGIQMSVMTRSDFAVARFRLTNARREMQFTTRRDLLHFECVGRSLGSRSQVAIGRIDLMRI